MKKNILLINLVIVIICNAYSQNTTSYGFAAGTTGESNSFFGAYAGLFNPAGSSYNTVAGGHS